MKIENWNTPTDGLTLKPDQVDVWRLSLDFQPDPNKLMESTLSAKELDRAERFEFDKDKHRYVVSHICLRDVLSRYLNLDPSQLTFEANAYGKPSLKDQKLEFNISHSGDFVLVAVTLDHKIGVDIERIRQGISSHVIAKQYFSPAEIKELEALPMEERVVAFFVCWSRKESYLKAVGTGLSMPLESFDVSLTPGEPAILRATRPDPNEAARWTIHSIEVDPAYKAAVAVENNKDLEYRLWDWRPR